MRSRTPVPDMYRAMAAHPSHSSTQATHLALSAARAALAATRLAAREPVLECASTDANIPIARGIPAIAIGAGGTGGGAHTLAE